MTTRTRKLLAGMMGAAAISVCGWAAMAATASDEAGRTAALEKILGQYSRATPGCAIGVEQSGRTILRAAGSADLEKDVPIGVETVFEAGSASKQFTAAAILLLVRDGKLSLDDDVRKYVPELPAYGTAITINHLLNHTSGLRDWGSLQGIAGWPRGERAYGMDEVLRVLSRQKSLNYEPGTAYSYTNSGYNLLQFIVERVSGKSLQAFSKENFFDPLGMTQTRWRDDFQAIVPRRATAYARAGGSFSQRMPFETVTGSGGLLTTVGDLLRWNRALDEGKLGPNIAQQMEQPGRLKDGRNITYAVGVNVAPYRGFKEIYHEGLTAGYHAWLSRFPERSLSIAILCNAQDIDTYVMGHEIADMFLSATPPKPLAKLTAAEIAMLEGQYVSQRSGVPLWLVRRNDALFLSNTGTVAADATPLGKDAQGRLVSGKVSIEVLGGGRIRQAAAADWMSFEKLSAPPPAAAPQELVGQYRSSEIDTTFIVAATPKCVSMTVEDRPGRSACLRPVYKDAYMYRGTLVRPVRATGGAVTGLRFSNERVWDLRAEKIN